jgi:hypothetical protein
VAVPAGRPAAPVEPAAAAPAPAEPAVALPRFGTGDVDDESVAGRLLFDRRQEGRRPEAWTLSVTVARPTGASNSTQTVTVVLLRDGKPVAGEVARIAVRFRQEDIVFTGRPNRPDGAWVMVVEVGTLTPGRPVPVEASTTVEGREIRGETSFAP